MSVFEKIKTGLEEAIAYEQGTLEAKTTKISIAPLKDYEASRIKNVRLNAGMTQVVFAEFMGVSVKTVEAWESGRNKPAGSACRLLALTENDPAFPQKSGIVAR